MNLIKGVGVDITKITRFSKILKEKYAKNFLNKALHPKEILELNALKREDLKAKFLASRWCYKEALVKASGNKSLIFSKVYLEKDSSGKPSINFDEEYIKNNEKINEINNKLHMSLSHEDDTTVAIVIIENNLK
jgi:holo-[acyl-carrier protein] synthase